MANSEEDMEVIMEKVNECVVEYGLKVNEKKSKVVCINGEVGRRRWMMGDCCIGEVEEYKYLGSKLMYGCGALAWYQRECDDLEVIQNGFGRWLWEVGNVRNELVRGESGWSSFAEREVKCIMEWLLRIVYEESLVSDIGRACLMEVGY